MGTYRKEWDCCGSVTETQSWEPDQCPFCAPAQSIADTAEELAALQERFNLVAAINASYVEEIRALRENIADTAEICDSCNGSGFADATGLHACFKCNGSGGIADTAGAKVVDPAFPSPDSEFEASYGGHTFRYHSEEQITAYVEECIAAAIATPPEPSVADTPSLRKIMDAVRRNGSTMTNSEILAKESGND